MTHVSLGSTPPCIGKPAARPLQLTYSGAKMIRTADHRVDVHCLYFTQVPQRVVCTGFSNGGAYAELCGIWAAIQWPAAPVRVIVWGAPVVSTSTWPLFRSAQQ
jgi:Lipase (class 3)